MWLKADELIPEVVSCSVCQREIPRAESLTAEGRDYLYFFCGAGCYEKLKRDPAAARHQHNGKT